MSIAIARKWIINTQAVFLRWLYIIGSALLLVITCFALGNIVRSMVADANISFDVLNFFSLNIYSFFSIVILTGISCLFFLISDLIFYCMHRLYRADRIPLMASTAVVGLIYLSFNLNTIKNGFEIFLLGWLLIFIYMLSNYRLRKLVSAVVTSQIIFWIFFFSLSITAIIVRENNIKEQGDRLQYAKLLATRSNPANEVMLNSIAADFNQVYLTNNFERLIDADGAATFRDSLISNGFKSFYNNYVSEIFVFDAQEAPLTNSHEDSFMSLNTSILTRARPTSVRGLYLFENSNYEFNYLLKRSIYDTSGSLQGYVFVKMQPRIAASQSAYAELFNRQTSSEFGRLNNYAFAVYNSDRLLRNENRYPFPTQINQELFGKSNSVIVKKGNVTELWYRAGPGKAVVIAKPNEWLLEFITLFSYFFCLFLLVSGIAWFANILYQSRLKWRLVKKYFKLNIRERIHGTIILLSVASFFIIGFATILFFVNRYEDANREKLSSTMLIIDNQVVREFKGKGVLDSLQQNIEPGLDSLKLAALFTEVSSIHGVELNLFDVNGKLIYSTLPVPYSRGLISNLMHPMAYIKMHNEKVIQYFQKESIGSLGYLAGYRPLINNKGDTYAYLNIPFYTSQNKIREEISGFLVTLINLNAFIFLIGGIIALFITNKIIGAFSLIGNKILNINLGKRNEEIVWNRDDEIGQLVKEYNTMLAKLDESATNLAKTEREFAWREMAKQVAHEIKNPLTPMKLSIQHLQRAIQNNAPNLVALSADTAGTIVEQIDHLTYMADEFSRFAQIGNTPLEKTDLVLVLESLKELYRNIPNATFKWELTSSPIYVMGNKTLLNRLFTNLLQNATQSVAPGNAVEITLVQFVKDNYTYVFVQDNGDGISEEAQTKIFTPNFTTKSSGTGLGLAMCKKIVEQAGGTISFTTGAAGTSFKICFPLLEG